MATASDRATLRMGDARSPRNPAPA
jgi:hypothetical protein